MKNNFEEKIMNQIKSGKVKVRSRYLFWAEKIGSVSGFILSMLFAIFLINLVIYYMRATGNLEYLSFGKEGIFAFLESFPSIFFLGGAIFTFAAGYFMAKNDISYKHPFVYIVLGLVIVISLSSAVLASSGVNDRFEEIAQKDKKISAVLRPFFNINLKIKNRGIVGRVIEISEESMGLKTVRGLIKLVPDNNNEIAIKKFTESNIEEDDFVIAIGKMINEEFVVIDIKRTAENKMPLIRKRIINNLPKKKCDLNKDGILDKKEQNRCIQMINRPIK